MSSVNVCDLGMKRIPRELMRTATDCASSYAKALACHCIGARTGLLTNRCGYEDVLIGKRAASATAIVYDASKGDEDKEDETSACCSRRGGGGGGGECPARKRNKT